MRVAWQLIGNHNVLPSCGIGEIEIYNTALNSGRMAVALVVVHRQTSCLPSG